MRQVPIAARPGEHVWVVAEQAGRIVYWSDIEDGWDLAVPNEHGGIEDRSSNQYELKHIAWQLFGSPLERRESSESL